MKPLAKYVYVFVFLLILLLTVTVQAQTVPDKQARRIINEVVGELKVQREGLQYEAHKKLIIGMQLYAQGKIYEARGFFKEAVKLDPFNLKASRYLNLCTQRLEEDRDWRFSFEQQRDLARSEEARDRTEFERKILHAEWLISQKRHQEAITLLREVQNDSKYVYSRLQFKGLRDYTRRAMLRAMAAAEPESGVSVPRTKSVPDANLISQPVPGTDPLLQRMRRNQGRGRFDNTGNRQKQPTVSAPVSLGTGIRPQIDHHRILRKRNADVLQTAVTARFNQTPLNEALDYLQTFCDVDISANRAALAQAGVDMNTPVTYSCKGASLNRVLNELTRQTRVSFRFVDGVLYAADMVSTDPNTGNTRVEQEAVVYDVSDLMRYSDTPRHFRDDVIDYLPPIPLTLGITDPGGLPAVIVSGTSEFFVNNNRPYYNGFGGYPYNNWAGRISGGWGGWGGWGGAGIGGSTIWPDASYSVGGMYGGVYSMSRYGGMPGHVNPGGAFPFAPNAGSVRASGPIWPGTRYGRTGWPNRYQWQGVQQTGPADQGQFIFNLNNGSRINGIPATGDREIRYLPTFDPYATGYTEQELIDIIESALKSKDLIEPAISPVPEMAPPPEVLPPEVVPDPFPGP